jgi:hypothetical protein
MINLKKLRESIVLITSAKKPNLIGTGFPFYREQNYIYLLTCAHVVEDMGDEENIRVNNFPVEVLAVGNIKGFDLAVLRIKQLLSIPILRLMALDGEQEISFKIKVPGFFLWGENKALRRKTIKGIMTVEVDGERAFQIIENLPEEAAIGKLKIDKGELQSGYSGAPVIDLETGFVVGVTTHKNDKEGKFGTAISIEALEKIWPEMPLEVSQQIIVEPVENLDNLSVEETVVEPLEISDNLSAEKIQPEPVENYDNLSAEETIVEPLETSDNLSVEETPVKPVEISDNLSAEETQVEPVESSENLSAEETQVEPVEISENLSAEETQTEPVENLDNLPVEEIQTEPVENPDNLSAEEIIALEQIALKQLDVPDNSPAQQITPPFDVIKVNRKGEEIYRRSHQARFFTEDLGNGVILEMIYIPGGTFIMGSPENEKGRYDKESPQHQVTLQPFYMSKYPITQSQYQAIMKKNPSHFKWGNRPVENVSWYNATKFCQKLSQEMGKNYGLPSESQWEYACLISCPDKSA